MPRFHPLPLGSIKPSGWLQQQIVHDLDNGYASRLDRLTEHAATDLFAQRIASSQHSFAWWDSETRGNWLWGYVMMAYLSGHRAHMDRVDALMRALLDTQDDDGYIGIYAQDSRYKHTDGENGELWAQGRALLALLAYYELTGNHAMLEAVERAVHLTMQQYGPHRPYFRLSGDLQVERLPTGLTHGLCYVDVLAWLYRLTGCEAYRDFGVWLYDDFCHMAVPFPNDDIARENLLDAERLFTGHAVHTVEHLRVLFWAAAMTRRADLEIAVQNALHKVRHYLLPSGAVIGDESIHGLPTPDMGYEYCTITELLFSLGHGLSLFGDVWYGDAIETLAFNAAQGARMADGKGIVYLSTDTRLEATAHRPDSYSYLMGKAGRFKFSPTHEDVACCCNPNSVRLLPHYISTMWQRVPDQAALAALVYGACSVETQIDGVGVRIDEETHYPFSDDIVMTVVPERAVEFAIYLRQPGWAGTLQVDVDDAAITTHDGYIVIRKIWQVGDQIRIRAANTIRVTPYPAGDYSVHYGALQFVLPIDHDLKAIKTYPEENFHDYDVLPVDLQQAHTPVILDGTLKDFGLSVQRNPDISAQSPWHSIPIRLVVDDRSLVPMGCTLLRRASFPIQRRAG